MARFTTLEELMDYIGFDSSGNITLPAIKVTGGGAISGGSRPISNSAGTGATIALAASDSGTLCINKSTTGSPSWTLPTAAAGLHFTFVCANTSTGFTVTGGTIKAKASATGAAITGTTLTHTQGTAVVGDTITLVCDGTTWFMTAQAGIFAAA